MNKTIAAAMNYTSRLSVKRIVVNLACGSAVAFFWLLLAFLTISGDWPK